MAKAEPSSGSDIHTLLQGSFRSLIFHPVASVAPVFLPANLQTTGFLITRRQWVRHTYLVGCYIENELGPVVNWSLVDKEIIYSPWRMQPHPRHQIKGGAQGSPHRQNRRPSGLHMKGIDASYSYEDYSTYGMDTL